MSTTKREPIEGVIVGEAVDELVEMKRILDALCKRDDAGPFLQPVDWEKLRIPDYPEIIKRPMDFATIRTKLNEGIYRAAKPMIADLRLVFSNAFLYNPERTPVYEMAQRLSVRMEEWLLTLNGPFPENTGLSILASERNWLASCAAILKFIHDQEQSVLFRWPVDLQMFPSYAKMIQKPMDLSTVRNRILSDTYRTANNFAIDMRLIWANAKQFNPPHDFVHKLAMELSNTFETMFANRSHYDGTISSLLYSHASRNNNNNRLSGDGNDVGGGGGGVEDDRWIEDARNVVTKLAKQSRYVGDSIFRLLTKLSGRGKPPTPQAVADDVRNVLRSVIAGFDEDRPERKDAASLSAIFEGEWNALCRKYGFKDVPDNNNNNNAQLLSPGTIILSNTNNNNNNNNNNRFVPKSSPSAPSSASKSHAAAASPAAGGGHSQTLKIKIKPPPESREHVAQSSGPVRYKGVNSWGDCARKILEEMGTHPDAWPFLVPVVPADWNCPDYFQKIRKPMDVSLIKSRLQMRSYDRSSKFTDDMKVMLSNAKMYNPPHNVVARAAERLTVWFEARFEELRTSNEPIVFKSNRKSTSSSSAPVASSPLPAPPKPESVVLLSGGGGSAHAAAAAAAAAAVAGIADGKWQKKAKNFVAKLMKEPDLIGFREQDPNVGNPKYDEYVKKPMHLSLINANLANNLYASLERFLADINRIRINVEAFYTSSKSQMPRAAEKLIAMTEEEFGKGCFIVSLPNASSEKRRVSGGTALSTSAIQKPPPQQPDWQTPAKEIVQQIMMREDGAPFSRPVDPVADGVRDYFSIIQTPMDLGTILAKLRNDDYSHHDHFAADVSLVWKNACAYNHASLPIHQTALKLNELFTTLWTPVAEEQARWRNQYRRWKSKIGKKENQPVDVLVWEIEALAVLDRLSAERIPKPLRVSSPADAGKRARIGNLTAVRNHLENGMYTSAAQFVTDVLGVFDFVLSNSDFGSPIFANTQHYKDVALDAIAAMEMKLSRGGSLPELSPIQARLEEERMKRRLSRISAADMEHLNACHNIVVKLILDPESWPFRVAPDRDLYPDYEIYVRQPMDLLTVKTKLERAEYTSPLSFYEDIRRVWENAQRYFGNETGMVWRLERLSQWFANLYKSAVLSPDEQAHQIRLEHENVVRQYGFADPTRTVLGGRYYRVMQYILRILSEHEHAGPFLAPIDTVKLNCPDYYQVITNPMDLGTIAKKMSSAMYRTVGEIATDVRQVFLNAVTFFNNPHPCYLYAEELSTLFESHFERMMDDGKRMGKPFDEFPEERCCVCSEGGDLLLCDGPCLRGFHLKCIKLRKPPKSTHWYCNRCGGSDLVTSVPNVWPVRKEPDYSYLFPGGMFPSQSSNTNNAAVSTAWKIPTEEDYAAAANSVFKNNSILDYDTDDDNETKIKGRIDLPLLRRAEHTGGRLTWDPIWSLWKDSRSLQELEKESRDRKRASEDGRGHEEKRKKHESQYVPDSMEDI